MNMRVLPLLVLISAFFIACNSNNKELMIGNWNAVSFIQEDSTYQIDLSRVQLSFDELGNYCYSSNLKHDECGHYKLQKNFLLLSDTLNQGQTEKNLFFEFISEDSLLIKMKQNELDQTLIFSRK